MKSLTEYIWRESPYRESLDFKETLGLQIVGENDRIYDYFSDLREEMQRVRFLADPRCVKDGHVYRIATMPNEVLRAMGLIQAKKQVQFVQNPEEPRQRLKSFKAIKKKKKIMGAIKKKQGRRKKAEKRIVIPLPFKEVQEDRKSEEARAVEEPQQTSNAVYQESNKEIEAPSNEIIEIVDDDNLEEFPPEPAIE